MRRRKAGAGSMATTNCPSSFKVSGSPTGSKSPATPRPRNPKSPPPDPSGHHQDSAIAQARHEFGECERVDSELRDRPVGSGIRLVIENMDGTVAHLEEIYATGEVPRRALRQQRDAVLALKLGNGIPPEPNRPL